LTLEKIQDIMIKNIIFDFGGVLLDLDYERTYAALMEVTGIDLESTEGIN